MSFTIAIVGRPNVGKSTLFNRLVGKRLALVDDTPGVTRDRREGAGRLADLRFTIIDTAGLEEGAVGSLPARMRAQTEAALATADVAILLIDARAGVTPLDRHFADWLRKGQTPVVLAANKCEGAAGEDGLYEAFGLGLGDPVGLSAEHGEGLGELYTVLTETLRQSGIDPHDDADETAAPAAVAGEPVEGDLAFEFVDEERDDDKPVRLAVVGRPNAGKSTLINHLVGEERLITGPEAGLTRDAIAVDWSWQGQPVRLFDTAGLRRKSRVADKLEKLSVADTLRAVQFAEVVVVIVDAQLGLEKQDLTIARRVVDEGRALVIALNKWDVVDDRLAAQRAVADALERALPQGRGVAVVTLSALTGQGAQKLMPAVLEAYQVWNARVPTAVLNRWLADVAEHHPPPAVSGRRIKLRYGAQIKTRPPTFRLFCNRPEDLPGSYLRYLENELRRAFDLPGTPIRLQLKKGENPYAGRRRKRRA